MGKAIGVDRRSLYKSLDSQRELKDQETDIEEERETGQRRTLRVKKVVSLMP